MISRILRIYRMRGASGVVSAIYRRLLHPRVTNFDALADGIRGRVGLEIGGPSDIFRRSNLFPVYPIAARVDNCNFGKNTTWEEHILEGDTFVFDSSRAPGHQFIAEATGLGFLAEASYDFILSSHTLEHVANPLKALAEWRRILKNDGLLVLVLPDHRRTFDRFRPVTTLQHLIDDRNRDVNESDPTHLDEILALHDFTRDPEAGSCTAFAERAKRNVENRCLHHHVFDPKLATTVVQHVGFVVLATQARDPFHILIVARKPAPLRNGPDESSAIATRA